MAEPSLDRLAETVLAACRAKRLTLATAESCTGGMVAAALTDIAGSSDVLERGLVSYSNQAKSELLAVPPGLIAQHGAVSAQVAEAMALGALQLAPVDLAVAVTGIAGPGGGTATKPVGLVWFGSGLELLLAAAGS
jgi:nicotinamide-nucleotide amidase